MLLELFYKLQLVRKQADHNIVRFARRLTALLCGPHVKTSRQVIIIPEEDIQAKGGGEEVLLVVIPKSGLAKRRTTLFDLFLKSDIDKDENHILGSSTVAITKKFKELIQKDELTIANLEGAGLEQLKVQYNNDVELEYHVSQLKAAVLSED
ncbi:hypothetical protein Tco_0520481 [Tanacetum coccineum]